MKRNEYDKVMGQIIDAKYDELQAKRKKGDFDKIYSFEGNAVGQTGEAFVKEILSRQNVKIKTEKDKTIHDEYDILTKSGKKIEVKTARLGANNTFQFNGLSPDYNYDYVALIGIAPTEIKGILVKGKVSYVHSKRSHYLSVQINGKEVDKKLVNMNPKNTTNLKLTLKEKEMWTLDEFVKDIKKEFS